LSNDDQILEEILKIYEKCDLPEESTIILEALSYVNKPEKIEKILEFALSVCNTLLLSKSKICLCFIESYI
jgi:hypothetical protein